MAEAGESAIPAADEGRTKVERELRGASRYFSAIFRNVPGALWVVDRNLRITFAIGSGNAFSIDEMKTIEGMTVEQAVAANSVTEPAVAHHLAALAGKRQAFPYAFRGRRFQITIEPLREGERDIVGCVGTAIDVTAGERIERELEMQRVRLEEAQRVAHIGSFEWDIARDVVSWSDELYRIHGIEPSAFGGKFQDFLQLVHSDDRDKVGRIVFGALRGGDLDYSHRIVRADGSVRVMQTRGVVINDDMGRPARVVGSCWDTTEQVAAIDKLEATLALLRATVDATADGVLVIDRAGKVSLHNNRFLELWGIPESLAQRADDEGLLRFVLDQLESPDVFLRQVHELYRNPERVSFDILRFKDGRVFQRHSRPERIGEEIVGRVWSFHDITEEQRLLRRAEFLADATRLLATLDVDPALDGVAHLAVPALAAACAIDLVGGGRPRRLLVVSHAEQSIGPELNNAALAGHPSIYRVEGVVHMALPLLVKRNVAGVMTFMAAPGRSYSEHEVDLFMELGRRVALSLENARLYRDARDALDTRNQFLSIAAHEIRGPVSSINLAVEGIQQEKFPKDSIARVLEIIGRAAHRLSRFVDELLDLGRINAGELVFSFQEVDLDAVVQRVVATMTPEATLSGSSLSVTTAGGAIGQWDGFRLEQVVTNLLSNAIRFGRGKPIAVVVRADADTATLAVQDHGIGIPPEAQAQLFQPFARGVSLRHYGGLGLGLHIVRTIVEGLGGKLRVESEPGVGSTFSVELPRAP